MVTAPSGLSGFRCVDSDQMVADEDDKLTSVDGIVPEGRHGGHFSLSPRSPGEAGEDSPHESAASLDLDEMRGALLPPITGGRGIGGVNRAVRRKNGPEETAIIHARKDLIALRDDRL